MVDNFLKKHILTKRQFYILSFTWGLPLTLCGAIVYILLKLAGYKEKKYGFCYYFEVGEYWGGTELGPIFLRDKKSLSKVSTHEFGHGIQNCFYGPFMILLVCIPSAIRYWTRELLRKLRIYPKSSYDSIWFERQASEIGEIYINHYVREPKEEALLILYWLNNCGGQATVRKLSELSGSKKTINILQNNVYDWFSKVSKDKYKISIKGYEALKEYRIKVKEIKEQY